MKIEHAAVWVKDLEIMRDFYETYFGGVANDKYINEQKQFESYFLKFDEGARLELMRKSGIGERPIENSIGWAHIAFSLGSKQAVDAVTAKLGKDGFTVVSGPRTTGDGYYESVVEDPEKNLLELTE